MNWQLKENINSSNALRQKPLALHGHERAITQIKYNRLGDLLFSSSKDSTPNVWYSINGERLGTFDGHNGVVWSIDCNCIYIFVTHLLSLLSAFVLIFISNNRGHNTSGDRRWRLYSTYLGLRDRFWVDLNRNVHFCAVLLFLIRRKTSSLYHWSGDENASRSACDWHHFWRTSERSGVSAEHKRVRNV